VNSPTAAAAATKPAPKSRVAAALFFLLFLIIVPLVATGCGPQIDVPANAQVALQEGQKKLELAKKAAASQPANSQEAQRLYGEAAAYFGAIARKFPGTDTGAKAVLVEADAYATGAKDNNTALQSIRTAIRQYPDAKFPQQARLIQKKYDELALAVDREHSGTIYYKVMDGLVRLVGGSKVLALVVVSIFITIALWPLRTRQYRASKEMMRYAPQLKKLQEKYKDDKGLQQEKVMAFYKEHGVNPFASCLPLLMQMPAIYLLYQCISYYQYQFTQTHFLWINPEWAARSADWPGFLAHIVGRNLGEQDVPLLFIYALSFYLQTKLNPVTDPAQAEQQKVMALTMPAVSFVMMLQYHLASAFVLYWFLSNALSVGQQWWLRRVDPMPIPGVDTIGDSDVAAADAPPSDNKPGPTRPKTTSGSGGGSGGGAKTSRPVAGGAPKPALSPNQRLISPKNRKQPKRSRP
jgi:YidC/Oxa1 family membrane protein insertase